MALNEEGALEFMQDAAFWVKQYQLAASKIEETLIEDIDKSILAYRIRFESGYRVTGLTSRPSNLRGKQGRVVADEFAFHPDQMELLKAAIALLMWNGRIHIISTHNGIGNPFNRLVEDVKAGKRPYSVHTVTLDDALKDGLYKRICLATGKGWNEKAQEEWRQELIDFYGDDADEELFCNPKAASGTYIPPLLVEARMDRRYSVARLALKDEFAALPQARQKQEIYDWIDVHIKPFLRALPHSQKSYYGMDFGRTGDISAIAPILIESDVRRYCPVIIELRNVPIRAQEWILYELVDGLPNFSGGAMDARGNGTALAEFAESRYGASRIDKVMPTQGWYLEAMPDYKKALEDDVFRMPYYEDLKTDHAAIKEENGVPKVPESSRYKGTDGGKRHGDGAMALVLGNYAARKKQGSVLRQTVMEESGYYPNVRDFFSAASARRERDVENERISSREVKEYF
jgi:phage FluMu gp28-like protein